MDSTIVGYSFDDPGGVSSPREGFIYTETNGMQGLGFGSRDLDTSYDGSVVGGTLSSSSDIHASEAFRWTEAGGLVGLGFLPGHNRSRLGDVSEDGSVVLGTSQLLVLSDTNEVIDRTDPEVFLWTESEGMVGTGILSQLVGTVLAANGSVIAGSWTVSSNDFSEAFRWTEETGVVGLGWLANGDTSRARDISDDGSLIVGWSGLGGSERAFIWSEQSGMEDFQQPIIDRHGLGPALEGWNLAVVYGMSSNGQFFTGLGYNPAGDFEGWLVRLDAPWDAALAGDFNGDGTVDGFDFLKWQRGESPDALSQSDLAAWEANYGTAPIQPGDFDSNGVVDGKDFLLWQRDPSVGSLAAWEANYGQVAPLSATSATVPEPATCIVLLIGMMTMLFRRDSAVSQAGCFLRLVKNRPVFDTPVARHLFHP